MTIMKCRVCGEKAPEIDIQHSNPIVRAIIVVAVAEELGWHLDGELAYCTEHHPQLPADFMEQLARARGDMLARAKARS